MALIADFVSGQSNVTYTRMRELLLESGGGLQEGVVSATDLKVAQRGAGANPSVDIPAGAGWITVDTGTRNGISHAFNDAVANVTVAAADGTNPRIDQACLQYNDTAIPAGTGGNIPTFRILTGTATAGATLDNRTGVAALPNDCLRLADILVPAASTSVTTANIRDRRPWARGAYRAITHPNTTDSVLSATTYSVLFTWTTPRIECSGAPLLLSLQLNVGSSTVASRLDLAPATDGTADGTLVRWMDIAASGSFRTFAPTWPLLPTSGSHTFDVLGKVTSGNVTLERSTTNGLPQLVIQEVVRPNADNT